MDLITVGVEKALQQRFPFAVFMQFVEHCDGSFCPKAIQLQGFRQRGWTAQEAPPVVGIIPVEILIAERPAGGGLSDLARSRNQGHLTMFFEVVRQDRGIETRALLHEDHYRAYRKIVQTILRWSRRWSGAEPSFQGI